MNLPLMQPVDMSKSLKTTKNIPPKHNVQTGALEAKPPFYQTQ